MCLPILYIFDTYYAAGPDHLISIIYISIDRSYMYVLKLNNINYLHFNQFFIYFKTIPCWLYKEPIEGSGAMFFYPVFSLLWFFICFFKKIIWTFLKNPYEFFWEILMNFLKNPYELFYCYGFLSSFFFVMVFFTLMREKTRWKTITIKKSICILKKSSYGFI